MDVWIRAGLIVLCSIVGSGGFWAYLQKKDTKRDATSRLMMGLAYDRLIQLGLGYIERGSISKDELEDFTKYFHSPYKELGGNGVADRIMREVYKLPFRPRQEHAEIFNGHEPGRFIHNVRVVSDTEQ